MGEELVDPPMLAGRHLGRERRRVGRVVGAGEGKGLHHARRLDVAGRHRPDRHVHGAVLPAGQDGVMRVLVAVASFGGSMTAPEAAQAVADGWCRVAPDDVLDLAPVSDGGPGFVDVLATALDATRLPCSVTGPHRPPPARGAPRLPCSGPGPRGRECPASVLMHRGTAYVESAQAIGLHLLA